MKTYLDHSFERARNNGIKKRRALAVLTVLSMFVTSGVVWGLRDTGVTMVNEELLCGYEEHEHNEDCYEELLVCDMAEGDEHTHSEECYELSLTCTLPAHLHDVSCFIGEEVEDPEQEDEVTEEIVYPDFIDTMEAEAPEAIALDDSNVPVAIAASQKPGTITTVDNEARGIHFTLFDYGTDDLDSDDNNYDIKQKLNMTDASNKDSWFHPKYGDPYLNKEPDRDVGWKDVGINEGRNPDYDILFFAYGTPAFYGKVNDASYTRTPPDRNNYSGDYNSLSETIVNQNNKDPSYLSTISGNRPVQGIVSKVLGDNGYPTIDLNETPGNSLAYLFDESPTKYKEVYKGVNHLLWEKEVRQGQPKHLYFNSNEKYAYFDETIEGNKNFVVYDGTFDIINDNHHQQNDPKPGGGTYETDVDPGFKIGFFPFDDYDITKRDPNFNTKNEKYNHHFGLKMEANFVNVGDQSNPATFKYSGDDDMWVFVDGKLVLDIGGIHEPAAGLIDFTNGLVWVQDNSEGIPKDTGDQNIKKQIQEWFYSDKFKTDEVDFETFWNNLEKPDGINTASTTIEEDHNGWLITTIDALFKAAGSEEGWNSTTGAEHSIKMFYLERGGCYSNLAMDINLPTVMPLTVTKTVDDFEDKEYSKNDEFEFEIYVENPANSGNYDLVAGDMVLGENNEKIGNPFKLKDGQSVYITSLLEGQNYKIREVNLDRTIYGTVEVSGGGRVDKINTANGVEFPINLNNGTVYEVKNIVNHETTKLKVNKNWEGDNQGQTHDPIHFKLYRKDKSLPNEPERPIVYNGHATFILKAENSWTSEEFVLPLRYGSHEYTYSVKEIDCPEGYTWSWSQSDDGNGTITFTITNKNKTNAAIHVRKDWENVDPSQYSIQGVLRRKYAEYETPKNTTLQIKVVDAANPTTILAQNSMTVYIGGNAEFQVEIPDGTSFADQSNPQPENCKMSFKDFEKGVFEVENIKDNPSVTVFVNTNGMTGSSEVKLTPDTILHYTFDNENEGWTARGDKAVVSQSNGTQYSKPYATNGMLSVKFDDSSKNGSSYNQNFNGAWVKLSHEQFKAGQWYTFYAQVMGTKPKEEGKQSFQLQLQCTKSDGAGYPFIKAVETEQGVWTEISGRVQIPENIDTSKDLFLYIQSNESEPYNFFIDEVIAVLDDVDVKVDAGTGKLRSNAEPIVHDTFENGFNDTDGWEPNGADYAICPSEGDKADFSPFAGSRSLKIYDIKESYGGPKKYLEEILQVGQSYSFSVSVAYSKDAYFANGGQLTDQMNFTMFYQHYNNGNYPSIQIATGQANAGQWITLSNTNFKITEGNQGKSVYLKSEMNGKYLGEFYIDEFVIAPAGYIIEIEKNTAPSGFSVNPNDDSVTKPVYINPEVSYVDDTAWSNSKDGEFTLSYDANDQYHGWFKSWDNEDLNQDSGRVYIYYVEELQIYDPTKGEWVRVNDNPDFEVTYKNNDGVESTDPNNPIVICNKYMWYKLPATGGSGTRQIYVFGAVLITIGTASIIINYRRKRRAG